MNIMQNKNIINQARLNFDKMLLSDVPGQNWDCDHIPDIGNGFENTGHSVSTRCVCYTSTERPMIRTSLADEIKRGDYIYINEKGGGTFYLLDDEPQKMPDCFKAFPSRCNAYITIRQTVAPEIDEAGFAVGDADQPQDVTIVRRLPAVTHHSQEIANARNTAGLTIADTLQVTIQLNDYTKDIKPEQWFELDRNKYTIMDAVTDEAADGSGTITLYCKRDAGTYNQSL